MKSGIDSETIINNMETSQELFSPKEPLAMLEAELVLRQKDLPSLNAELRKLSDNYYRELDPVIKRKEAEEFGFLQIKRDQILLEIQELEQKIKLKNINTKI